MSRADRLFARAEQHLPRCRATQSTAELEASIAVLTAGQSRQIELARATNE
jgi:hypothetical protein